MTNHGLTGIPYENFFLAESASQMQEDFLQRLRNGSLTAAIASNADTALRLCQLCAEHNIRIPENLSVLCFDNPNSGRKPTGSFFTYLEQNSLDMGRLSALLLKQSLDGDIGTDDGQIVLQPELVVNASTRQVL